MRFRDDDDYYDDDDFTMIMKMGMMAMRMPMIMIIPHGVFKVINLTNFQIKILFLFLFVEALHQSSHWNRDKKEGR